MPEGHLKWAGKNGRMGPVPPVEFTGKAPDGGLGRRPVTGDTFFVKMCYSEPVFKTHA